jgi:hypothetical protein
MRPRLAYCAPRVTCVPWLSCPVQQVLATSNNALTRLEHYIRALPSRPFTNLLTASHTT